MPTSGSIIVTMPVYYVGPSGNSQSNMIADTGFACSLDRVSLSTCLHTTASRTLTYSYTGGTVSAGTTVTLTVDTFKNPINTGAKTGWKVETRDASNFVVDSTSADEAITAMTTAATFEQSFLALPASLNPVGQDAII